MPLAWGWSCLAQFHSGDGRRNSEAGRMGLVRAAWKRSGRPGAGNGTVPPDPVSWHQSKDGQAMRLTSLGKRLTLASALAGAAVVPGLGCRRGTYIDAAKVVP